MCASGSLGRRYESRGPQLCTAGGTTCSPHSSKRRKIQKKTSSITTKRRVGYWREGDA